MPKVSIWHFNYFSAWNFLFFFFREERKEHKKFWRRGGTEQRQNFLVETQQHGLLPREWGVWLKVSYKPTGSLGTIACQTAFILLLLLLQLFLVRRKTFETFLETLHGKNGRLVKNWESERMYVNVFTFSESVAERSKSHDNLSTVFFPLHMLLYTAPPSFSPGRAAGMHWGLGRRRRHALFSLLLFYLGIARALFPPPFQKMRETPPRLRMQNYACDDILTGGEGRVLIVQCLKNFRGHLFSDINFPLFSGKEKPQVWKIAFKYILLTHFQFPTFLPRILNKILL